MEKRQFRHNKQNIDMLQHCIEQKVAHKNLKVFIGTDSISLAGNIHYFLVIAFRYEKNGAHFIYSKETIKSFRKPDGKPDVFLKLWRECEMSIGMADYLVEKGIFTRDDIVIELDYNNVAETLSKPLLPATRGWALSAGYQCLAKIPHDKDHPERTDLSDMVCLGNPEKDKYGKPLYPSDWTDMQIACKAANHLCKGT